MVGLKVAWMAERSAGEKVRNKVDNLVNNWELRKDD
jgi:hypothetical protein